MAHKGRGHITSGITILGKKVHRDKMIECYAYGNTWKTACHLVGITEQALQQSRWYKGMKKRAYQQRAEMVHLFASQVVEKARKGSLQYANLVDWLARLEKGAFGKKEAEMPKKLPGGISGKLESVLDRKQLPPPRKIIDAQVNTVKDSSLPSLDELKASLAEPTPPTP